MHVNSCSHLFFGQYIFSQIFEIISLAAFEHGCKILARNWARFAKKKKTKQFWDFDDQFSEHICSVYKNKMLKT